MASPTTAYPAANNCANADSWGKERRLTADSFDILDAPETSSGHFLGDYMGSESLTKDIHPAYGIVHGANQVSVFTREITVALVRTTTAAD